MNAYDEHQMTELARYLAYSLVEIEFQPERNRVVLRDHAVIVSSVSNDVTPRVKTDYKGI